MFKYKNGRACFGKLSFVFPEGLIFNNDAEETYFNGFSFLAPKGYNSHYGEEDRYAALVRYS